MSRFVVCCVALGLEGERLVHLQSRDVVLLLRLRWPRPHIFALRFFNDSAILLVIISRAPTFGLSAISVRILPLVRNASFPNTLTPDHSWF